MARTHDYAALMAMRPAAFKKELKRGRATHDSSWSAFLALAEHGHERPTEIRARIGSDNPIVSRAYADADYWGTLSFVCKSKLGVETWQVS